MNQAQTSRDEAIQRADGGADVRFKELAFDAVKEVAQKMREFTTDDVQAACGVDFEEPRVWGAIMMRAARDGLIKRTERTRQSVSRVCHAREKRIWESLIYRAPQNKPAPLFEMEPEYPR